MKLFTLDRTPQLIEMFISLAAVFKLALAAANMHPAFHRLQPPSGKPLLLIDQNLAMSHADARSACQALGMSLAVFTDLDDLRWVGGYIGEGEAWWIGEFKAIVDSGGGPKRDAECLAAFPGGAVAKPAGDCRSNHAVLCQEPV
jgi:hypothetical protein